MPSDVNISVDNDPLETNTTQKPHQSDLFRRTQWKMLLVTMFCYLFYYTGRQNFGFAILGIQDSFNLTPSDTGLIAAGLLLFYGFGQVINGNLGDKYGARVMMALGAILSFIFNWITSFGIGFWTLLIPWCINGYVQSLGFAPGSRLISNWWPRKERALAFGLYVFASGFSSVITFAGSIIVLLYFSWEYLFRIPVFFMLFSGIIFYIFARNKPEDVGMEPLNEPDVEQGEQRSLDSEETAWQRYSHVLKNKKFYLACVTLGFTSFVRYSLIFWVPVFYLGDNCQTHPAGVWLTVALPLGMALGSLVSGVMSDRRFK